MAIVGKNVKGEVQEGKIRNVLNDPYEEDVCLDDVIKALVGSGKGLAPLEYKNTKHALKTGKRAFKEAKMVFLAFEKRLKEEIGADIIAIYSND